MKLYILKYLFFLLPPKKQLVSSILILLILFGLIPFLSQGLMDFLIFFVFFVFPFITFTLIERTNKIGWYNVCFAIVIVLLMGKFFVKHSPTPYEYDNYNDEINRLRIKLNETNISKDKTK